MLSIPMVRDALKRPCLIMHHRTRKQIRADYGLHCSPIERDQLLVGEGISFLAADEIEC